MVEAQEVIEFMRREAYKPMTVHELLDTFRLSTADDFRAFLKLLNQLEERGEVVRTRTDRYGVPERMNLVVGRLQMKARGYGFVIPDVPGHPDLYVPAGDLNGAMSGDKVLARPEKSTTGPRLEGRILRILERTTQRMVGKLSHHRDHAFVTPLDKRFPQDVLVSREDTGGAHDGYVVVVEITSFPTATRGPQGRVVEVLGHPDAPGIDILSVVRKYALPEAFPEEVLAEAEAIDAELTPADLQGRRDLRHEVIVTIDGEDAKDLDDAVHVRRLENGNYLLGVHIADVGYYVRQGSALDREAYRRGTSVYLVDRVIPMLPQRLSNNICSLNPKVDRLTMTCEMEFTPDGERIAHDIYPSVIRTTERMTYSNVNRILVHRQPDVVERYRDLVPMFRLMEELALILRRKRMDRGAIDFDFAEVKVVVDDVGHPVDIVQRERSIAERIIEEFMLAANETVAEHFHWLEVPFVYRIHEDPDITRMMEFNAFIHNFGYHVKGANNKVHPRSLQRILEEIRGTREERVISTMMLRSMRQARYSPECVGHFGLAATYYTHFTSPIRRYPDLMIHRIIREVLTRGLDEERADQLREYVTEGSAHASERERIAQDAERECDQLKMVEYMLDHIGETYDGIISGVTSFGLFVQLMNGVEGLIHISYLTDDYYVLNDKQMALVGERTRRVFRLGDPVRIQVVGANKEELTIDFQLVAHQREGTMVSTAGGDRVVYDEDLSPADRRRQIAEREALSRHRKPRVGGFRSAEDGPARGHGKGAGKERRKRASVSGKQRGSGKGGGNRFAKSGVRAAKQKRGKGRRGRETWT
ncbi:ribonuclease R [Alicyclobacillus contaminans]|uniref:ribonuclease R n=1 Tax=Alicyclobacillus contaminans TaxID=392016 RepID=UPI00040D9930|nr:ribonuclease R [Alicyclobacillus contaminans]